MERKEEMKNAVLKRREVKKKKCHHAMWIALNVAILQIPPPALFASLALAPGSASQDGRHRDLCK
jgi:hypothetical protein